MAGKNWLQDLERRPTLGPEKIGAFTERSAGLGGAECESLTKWTFPNGVVWQAYDRFISRNRQWHAKYGIVDLEEFDVWNQKANAYNCHIAFHLALFRPRDTRVRSDVRSSPHEPSLSNLTVGFESKQ